MRHQCSTTYSILGFCEPEEVERANLFELRAVKKYDGIWFAAAESENLARVVFELSRYILHSCRPIHAKKVSNIRRAEC